jgi:hypothetical protein
MGYVNNIVRLDPKNSEVTLWDRKRIFVPIVVGRAPVKARVRFAVVRNVSSSIRNNWCLLRNCILCRVRIAVGQESRRDTMDFYFAPIAKAGDIASNTMITWGAITVWRRTS